MEYEREHVTAGDGVKLNFQKAVLSEEVRCEVVLTHGRGEHSGRYGHVVEAFARQGIRVWNYDLRGHGRSEGRRGDVPSYEQLLEDLDLVVGRARATGLPVVMMGHSMGGQITLNYLLSREHGCVGAVVASPYLRLAYVPPLYKRALARSMRWVWPTLTQSTVQPWQRLSKDRAHLESLPDRHLTHHVISARMYHEICEGADRALAGAKGLRVPILLLHGEKDPVTSLAATREFFGQVASADKTLKVYDGMLHETHNELGREQVIGDVIEWILARPEVAAAGPREGVEPGVGK